MMHVFLVKSVTGGPRNEQASGDDIGLGGGEFCDGGLWSDGAPLVRAAFILNAQSLRIHLGHTKGVRHPLRQRWQVATQAPCRGWQPMDVLPECRLTNAPRIRRHRSISVRCPPRRLSRRRSGQPPPGVDAGAKFFSPTQMKVLQKQYGRINLFRYGNTWILIGNGESTTSTDPSSKNPWGPLVAVDQCGATDFTCFNPNRAHRPQDFTVVPLPDPHAVTTLEGTYGGRLLVI